MKLGVIAALTAFTLFLAAAPVVGAAIDDAKAGIQAAQAGKFQQAVEAFTRAIAAGELKPPALALVYNNRAHAYNELKQYEDAVTDATEAIKLNPKYANAYNTLGNAYRRQSKYREAINYYSKAILLEPTADYFANRCLARGQNNQPEIAVPDCEKALSIDSGHKRAKAILTILKKR